MAMISLRQLLDHAAEQGYGVPAFNINNMEQIIAITQAAEETPGNPAGVGRRPEIRGRGLPCAAWSRRPLRLGPMSRSFCIKTMAQAPRYARRRSGPDSPA
jgi:Fructose-bisphosphate aldolase class-II